MPQGDSGGSSIGGSVGAGGDVSGRDRIDIRVNDGNDKSSGRSGNEWLRRIDSSQERSAVAISRIEEKLYGVEGDRRFSLVGRIEILEREIAALRRQLYLTGVVVVAVALVVLLAVDFISRLAGG